MSHQAKAEEENRVDMKNSELSATNDLSSVYRWEQKQKNIISLIRTKQIVWGKILKHRCNIVHNRKNPNIATGDSPPKEVGDKSSATFVSVVRIWAYIISYLSDIDIR